MSKKWFQEVPNSYKIQVMYQDIPSFVKTHPIDTPFRFTTYEDADTVGREIFNGVKFRIVGSNDRPHWQSTSIEKAIPETLSSKVWYDLYGITPAQVKLQKQSLQATESLKKLKPQVVTSGIIKNN